MTTVRIKNKAINTTYTSVTGTTSSAYVNDTITVLSASPGGTVANNLILAVATVGATL